VDLKNIIFEKAAIATLTVNRPGALNALNREVLEEMARVIREVRHDSSARANRHRRGRSGVRRRRGYRSDVENVGC